MGRAAAYTQEQVFEMADKLAVSGKEVTPTTLREALGRGSFSTLGKFINIWQETRRSDLSPVRIEMPEGVKASFMQCWQAAVTEAGREIAAIRGTANTEIKAARQQLDEIERLETEANAEAARLETAENKIAEAAARQAALSATVDQMQKQIETQQTELAAAHKEARELAAQLGRASGELDALRKVASPNDSTTKRPPNKSKKSAATD
jgi:DNA repair exonuclease SbcCD ATPase subunit